MNKVIKAKEMNSHLCCMVEQVNLRIGRGMSGEIGSPKIACLIRPVNDRMQKRERAECDAIKRRIMMSRNGQEGKSDAMRAMADNERRMCEDGQRGSVPEV